MDEETFAHVMMYQVIELNQTSRAGQDIISELEQHIRAIEDGGDSVITRGC